MPEAHLSVALRDCARASLLAPAASYVVRGGGGPIAAGPPHRAAHPGTRRRLLLVVVLLGLVAFLLLLLGLLQLLEVRLGRGLGGEAALLDVDGHESRRLLGERL